MPFRNWYPLRLEGGEENAEATAGVGADVEARAGAGTEAGAGGGAGLRLAVTVNIGAEGVEAWTVIAAVAAEAGDEEVRA